jgi:hypothetical protein
MPSDGRAAEPRRLPMTKFETVFADPITTIAYVYGSLKLVIA